MDISMPVYTAHLGTFLTFILSFAIRVMLILGLSAS